MNTSKLEFTVGTFLLIGIAAVAYLALAVGDDELRPGEHYLVSARFTNVGGLRPGDGVLIAGVAVGRVASVALAPDYTAVAELQLRADVSLPADTMASVRTSGLVGDPHVLLTPGGDIEHLVAGGLITETEPAVDLLSLIGRVAFGGEASDARPEAR